MSRHGLPAAAASAALLSLTNAYALPTGENVVNGSVTISRPGAQSMQIDQATQKGIVNWQSFSIGAGERVSITQPGASSVLLNRVVGSSPSEIFGRLSANGQVFLTNPSGVLFAPGASVEVGALMASTLSITNEDFLAGRYVFSNAGATGEVVNQGSIVTPNGYTALAGPKVRNDGVIAAQLGTVALAAGDRVTLDMVGDGLINVSVDQAALNASALNAGSIEANGGRILMRAESAAALLDTVINNTGTLRATRLNERNGEIVLETSTGIIRSTTIPETETLIVNAPEAHFGDPLEPGTPTSGGGLPVIQPLPEISLQPGQIAFTGSFSISGSVAMQVTQPASTAVPLTLQGGSITNTPITGAIAVTNNIGVLAPMGHTIVGTGISVPAEARLLLK